MNGATEIVVDCNCHTSRLHILFSLIWGVVFGIIPAAIACLAYLLHYLVNPPNVTMPLSFTIIIAAISGYYIYILYIAILSFVYPGKISICNDHVSIKPAMEFRKVTALIDEIDKIMLGRDLGFDVISKVSVRNAEPTIIYVGIASNKIQTFVTALIALNPSIEIVPYDKSHPGNIIMKRLLRHW